MADNTNRHKFRDSNWKQRNAQRNEGFSQRKLNIPLCARCSEPIVDVTAALADKETGLPVHFDCVLTFLQNAENLKQCEKIVYIGQGRFAVAVFENPHDLRKFTIDRIIEWEERDKKYEWRATIADVFSQIK